MSPAPPTRKPQLLSVGAFSCLIAPVPACCRELLRKPADFANLSNWPFRTTFHSLLAIPRSDLSSVARYLALICAIFGTDGVFQDGCHYFYLKLPVLPRSLFPGSV